MSGPAPAVREHYRDFYDGLHDDPSDDQPVLVVHGNCQAESVRLLLDAGDVRSVRVPPVHELTAYDVEPLQRLAARIDLLVAQPVGPDQRGLPVGTDQLRALLRPGTRTALVPNLRYSGLHPTHVVVHPAHLTDAEPPHVPYHDVRTAVRAAWRRSGRPLPGDVSGWSLTPERVQAVGAASVAELARREAHHGTVPASDLLAHPTFATTRTIDHPGNAWLEPVAARLREALGLPPAAPGVDRPLLDAVHAPVEAEVAAVHEPAATPRRSWLVDGSELPTEVVDRAHLDFYARRPDVLDAVLERSAPVLDLLDLPLPEGSPS